jgi:dnd system-associated protein 4
LRIEKMIEDLDIVLAARTALENLDSPQSVESILAFIRERGLYAFNTAEPESFLKEQIRKHCVGDAPALTHFAPKWFVQISDDLYDLRVRREKLRSGEPRRIYRAKDKEDVIQSLVAKNERCFSEIWRVLIFAAVLGVKRGVREPLTEFDSARAIDFQTFSNSPTWPGLLHLMTLCEWDDAIALSSSPEIDEDRIRLFEEYANGGLSLLKATIETKSYSLDGIVDLLYAETVRTLPPPDTESIQI